MASEVTVELSNDLVMWNATVYLTIIKTENKTNDALINVWSCKILSKSLCCTLVPSSLMDQMLQLNTLNIQTHYSHKLT